MRPHFGAKLQFRFIARSPQCVSSTLRWLTAANVRKKTGYHFCCRFPLLDSLKSRAVIWIRTTTNYHSNYWYSLRHASRQTFQSSDTRQIWNFDSILGKKTITFTFLLKIEATPTPTPTLTLTLMVNYIDFDRNLFHEDHPQTRKGLGQQPLAGRV